MRTDPRLVEIDDCLYRLAIRALIFHEGKVLLIREKDAAWWGFPGGGIDHGEDIAQALSRELSEELGISAAAFKTDYQIIHVGIGTIVNGVPRANLFYRVEIPADCIRVGEDVLELRWFTPAEITLEITSRYAVSSTNDVTNFMEIIEAHAAL